LLCVACLLSISLLSNLARDLRSEFTPLDLGRIFTTLLSPSATHSLLDTRAPETLQTVFSTVVWLQKFLSKQLSPHVLVLFWYLSASIF
jgi:hypothetical protein